MRAPLPPRRLASPSRYPRSSVDCDGRIRVEVNPNGTGGVDYDRRARADRATQPPGEDVAVAAGRHPRRNRGVHDGALPVDGDEPLVAPRERDRVLAVIPPVVEVGSRDSLAQPHHAHNGGLALPPHPPPPPPPPPAPRPPPPPRPAPPPPR